MVDLSKMKDIYISEVSDHVQKLNDNLLALEKNPKEKPILDELMRSSHTIKGSSAVMGYAKTAFLTHVLEDVFDFARNNMLEINSEIIDELLVAVDSLEKSIQAIKTDGKEIDLDEASERIKKMTGVNTEGIGKSARSESGKPIVAEKETILKKKTSSGKGGIGSGKKKDAGEKVAVPVVDDEKTEVSAIDYIKVPVERLDKLLDFTEELLIDKMRLQQLVEAQKKIFEGGSGRKQE